MRPLRAPESATCGGGWPPQGRWGCPSASSSRLILVMLMVAGSLSSGMKWRSHHHSRLGCSNVRATSHGNPMDREAVAKGKYWASSKASRGPPSLGGLACCQAQVHWPAEAHALASAMQWPAEGEVHIVLLRSGCHADVFDIPLTPAPPVCTQELGAAPPASAGPATSTNWRHGSCLSAGRVELGLDKHHQQDASLG